MKSELITSKEIKDCKFPLLAKFTHSSKTYNDELVVLFTSEHSGAIVRASKEPERLGEHSNNYDSCFGRYWTILPKGSQVILTVD